MGTRRGRERANKQLGIFHILGQYATRYTRDSARLDNCGPSIDTRSRQALPI